MVHRRPLTSLAVATALLLGATACRDDGGTTGGDPASGAEVRDAWSRHGFTTDPQESSATVDDLLALLPERMPVPERGGEGLASVDGCLNRMALTVTPVEQDEPAVRAWFEREARAAGWDVAASELHGPDDPQAEQVDGTVYRLTGDGDDWRVVVQLFRSLEVVSVSYCPAD